MLMNHSSPYSHLMFYMRQAKNVTMLNSTQHRQQKTTRHLGEEHFRTTTIKNIQKEAKIGGS